MQTKIKLCHILAIVVFLLSLIIDPLPLDYGFILIVCTQNALLFSLLPAFGAVFGLFCTYISIRAAPDFMSIKPNENSSPPKFLGGLEFAF